MAVAATTKRNDKVDALAAVIGRLTPDEIVPAIAFLTGTTPLGRIGVGWSTLADVEPPPVPTPTLTVGAVDRAVTALAAMSGSGVTAARREALADLFGTATEAEQRLLRGILGGELRQGALDGVVTTAVAKAAGVPVASVRRAAMMAGALGPAAHAALTGGADALAAVALVPLRAVQPMLASPAGSVGEAIDDIGTASVEWKLDGARIQAHRSDGEVRLFTRNLNDITDRLPGVVAAVRSMSGGDLVLDGEVMGLLDDGALDGRDDDLGTTTPRRFQDTMGDFGADGEAGRGAALRAFFFDVMYLGGRAVHDEPLATRRMLLEEHVPDVARLPSIVTADAMEAQAFMDRAVELGHEGVMVKGLDDRYEAGRRGKSWRKVKPVHTLDLVVIAVEWGHGRRTGTLSNLHLGARSEERDGEFVMVGKTFKGMTDEMLRWQTERFQELAIGTEHGRAGRVVHVRPEQVVEIAVDGVQASTRYPGGVALRFARVKRYRHDKAAAQADPISAVQALLR
ncbi:MAG: ATP-dependent DNA ligase [Ilumatobacter sp.]|nr:ATP-dependent DNA ligase [Ilumatobacter sp.]